MRNDAESRSLLASYVIGFILSVGLTLIAYFGVTQHWFTSGSPAIALLCLALVQFAVQLFFFLHIGRETKPRWKLLMLFFAILFVMIVIIGSIWVMYSLNYRMTPDRINQYLKQQDGGI
jgi:cytochrome o ubiquinol oxidase operon protein cyoD